MEIGKIEKAGTIRKKKVVDLKSGNEIIDITPVEVFISGPSGEEPLKIKKEDVWGEYDVVQLKKISNGMVVASSDETCPVFGDVIPYKSVTVICDENQFNDVKYWLEYVHGADCIAKTKILENGKIAIRSNYQCW